MHPGICFFPVFPLFGFLVFGFHVLCCSFSGFSVFLPDWFLFLLVLGFSSFRFSTFHFFRLSSLPFISVVLGFAFSGFRFYSIQFSVFQFYPVFSFPDSVFQFYGFRFSQIRFFLVCRSSVSGPFLVFRFSHLDKSHQNP